MIGSLKGTITHKTPGELIIDVGGVGYRVIIPLSTFYTLKDDSVNLFIYTNVRDDAINLYGFATVTEKTLFEKLITIQNVGPSVAIAVLSGISPADLVHSIQGGDVNRLMAIPRVGRKTAERICLELRDKLDGIVLGGRETAAQEIGKTLSGQAADAISALVHLGYRQADVRSTVKKICDENPDASIETIITLALRNIS